MKIEDLQKLREGDIIYWEFYMAGMGEGFKNHAFTILKIDFIDKPQIENPYWVDQCNFGPAKKLIIEDYETKKKFYLIVPINYELERYIYFSNDEGIPADNLDMNK